MEWVCRGLARLREFLQVRLDLALMPCPKDGLNVGEVLVEGRPSDAGLLSYLRHRDGAESLLGYEPNGCVLDRLADLVATGW